MLLVTSSGVPRTAKNRLFSQQAPLPWLMVLPLICLITLVVVVETGCTHGRYEKKVVKDNPFRRSIEADLSGDWLGTYRKMPASNDAEKTAKKERRNEILNEFVWLADDAYYRWEPDYFHSGGAIQTFFDFASLGLTGAVPVANSPKVLGAMSTGFQGAGASISKNFYDQQARSVIVQKMRQLREAALVRIADGEQKAVVDIDPKKEYSIEQGLVDIQNYYHAGTVTAALQGLATSTAEKSQSDKSALNDLRTQGSVQTPPTQPQQPPQPQQQQPQQPPPQPQQPQQQPQTRPQIIR